MRPTPIKTSAATSRAPSPTSLGEESLPDAQVLVDGKHVRLNTLVPAVLAWVPQYCTCLLALRQLSQQAAQAHVHVYLVGTDRAVPELPALAKQVGQPVSAVVNDTSNALGAAYSPMGLTAILADRDGQVGVRQGSADREPAVAADLPALASSAPRSSASTPAVPSQPAPQAS